jgi:hypothetical protein
VTGPDVGQDALGRLTAICLALPEVQIEDVRAHRGFRVAKKNFAWYTVDHHGNGAVELGVRTDLADQRALVAADPDRFSVARYVGRHGWVDYRLDLEDRPVDWAEVAELVADSYRLQAPKRLVRLLDQPAQ